MSWPTAPLGAAIFTSREAADEFVAGDPFVLEGVVASVETRARNEVLAP